jgi:hypothetical protein
MRTQDKAVLVGRLEEPVVDACAFAKVDRIKRSLDYQIVVHEF